MSPILYVKGRFDLIPCLLLLLLCRYPVSEVLLLLLLLLLQSLRRRLERLERLGCELLLLLLRRRRSLLDRRLDRRFTLEDQLALFLGERSLRPL